MITNAVAQADEPVRERARCEINRPYRILVADDDISIRELSAEVLIGFGYQVDVAEDGAAAWEALHANRYDLLITDNTMPKVSGVELLKKLRAAGMELPVIMVTGALPTRDLTQYPWRQPDATLLKPFVIGQLLETVRVVLRVTESAEDQIQPPLPDLRSLSSAGRLQV